MKRLNLYLLRFYQSWISPLLRSFNYSASVGCCFYPSCSEYTKQAIEQFGVWRGWYLGLKRLAHCHPWSSGGVQYPVG